MKTKLFLLLSIAMFAFTSCENEPKVEPLHVFTYDVSVKYFDYQKSSEQITWRDTIQLSIRTTDEAVLNYYKGFAKKFTDFSYSYSSVENNLYPKEIMLNDELYNKLPKLTRYIAEKGVILNFILLSESIE